MHRRISKDARPKDVNQAAFQMVRFSTQEPEIVPERRARRRSNVSSAEISRVMSAMGRRGGKLGGKRSLETMTPEERKQRASLAAKTRWTKNKKKKSQRI